ncbi:MAG: DUF6455 family protein [Beijerinckiaceae bacterium]
MPVTTTAAEAARSKIARWVKKIQLLAELNGLDAATRAEIMRELNVSEADVSAMASLSLNSDGLERVLRLIGFDVSQLEHDEPALMADLRRSCSMCGDWKKCEKHLDTNRFSAEIEDYCVNRDVLRTLRDAANQNAPELLDSREA